MPKSLSELVVTGIRFPDSSVQTTAAIGTSQYATTIGNNVLTSFTITHNLGTTDVFVWLKDVGTGEIVYGTPVVATTNTITLVFDVAPTTNQYKVYVLAGVGGAPSFAQMSLYGTRAARPAAGTAGRWYHCSDSPYSYRDNGTTWDAFFMGEPVTEPDDSAFAWVNQTNGGVTATSDATYGGIHIHAAPSSNGYDHRIRKKSLAATSNYRVAVRFRTLNTGQQLSVAGMCVRLASSGNLIIWGRLASSGEMSLLCNLFTTPSTQSTIYYNQISRTAEHVEWFAIRDDATNRYYELSINGKDWEVAFSHARTTGITPDEVGMFYSAQAGVSGSAGGAWFTSFKEA